MPSISQDGKNRCVTGVETTSFQSSLVCSIPDLVLKLFAKAASITEESAASPATLFFALFFGEKLHSINSFLVLLMML